MAPLMEEWAVSCTECGAHGTLLVDDDGHAADIIDHQPGCTNRISSEETA